MGLSRTNVPTCRRVDAAVSFHLGDFMKQLLTGSVLLVAAVVSGCGDDEGGPTGPKPGSPATLQVGQVFTTSASQAGTVQIRGGPAGAEYVYIPFYGSDVGDANLALEVQASGAVEVQGPPNPSLAPGAVMPLLSRTGAAGLQRDEAFEERLRRMEERVLTRMIPDARALRSSSRGPLLNLSQSTAPAPQVGDLLQFNVQAESTCNNPVFRTGRVVAVTDRAIVAADTSNPAGGFAELEYREVAAAFDTLVYPVDTRNFGTPTDIDGNGRVILFYTRAVNELTDPNSDSFVGGFFFGRDLFPRDSTPRLQGCSGSNVAEIMYLLAPDPEGSVNSNKRSKEFVLQQTVGVIAHEFQHMINAGRRLYVNEASKFEEVWLNEGLSHIAEELIFYAASGLQPRNNLDLTTIRANGERVLDFNTHQAANFGRFITYLENPDTSSLIGVDDNLPTRGATWAFLRYAADRESGDDAAFFQDLVNSPTIGIKNLQAAINAEPLDWFQDWSVSVYADDAVPVDPKFLQPSWNFRSIMSAFKRSNGRYPLKVTSLAGTTPTTLTLQGGGSAFLRFALGPSGSATIKATSGGAAPPAKLRISIVRTK